MTTSDYKELKVWQKSMALVTEVYSMLKALPGEERFALGDQLRRCSVSIPSNIAEGHDRNSDKEFLHFLSISHGLLAEMETQIMICMNLGYIDNNTCSQLLEKSKEIGIMLRALMRKVHDRCRS